MDAETKQAFAEMIAELKNLNKQLASIDNRLYRLEQAHYEEVSGKITLLSEKQEELEKVQNQHSIDIMQLRAAQ